MMPRKSLYAGESSPRKKLTNDMLLEEVEKRKIFRRKQKAVALERRKCLKKINMMRMKMQASYSQEYQTVKVK